jgi:hypothetical protein
MVGAERKLATEPVVIKASAPQVMYFRAPCGLTIVVAAGRRVPAAMSVEVMPANLPPSTHVTKTRRRGWSYTTFIFRP